MESQHCSRGGRDKGCAWSLRDPCPLFPGVWSIRFDWLYRLFDSLTLLLWLLIGLKLWLLLSGVGMTWELLTHLFWESWWLPGKNILPCRYWRGSGHHCLWRHQLLPPRPRGSLFSLQRQLPAVFSVLLFPGFIIRGSLWLPGRAWGCGILAGGDVFCPLLVFRPWRCPAFGPSWVLKTCLWMGRFSVWKGPRSILASQWEVPEAPLSKGLHVAGTCDKLLEKLTRQEQSHVMSKGDPKSDGMPAPDLPCWDWISPCVMSPVQYWKGETQIEVKFIFPTVPFMF